MKIYVASSWRNEHQPEIVTTLRKAGHDVYDFRDAQSFHWSQIDSNSEYWTKRKFKRGLDHPLAVKGFDIDFSAMEWADICVLVLPCNKSAHLEAGWFVGKGKPAIILLDGGELELMYKMCNICTSTKEMIELLDTMT